MEGLKIQQKYKGTIILANLAERYGMKALNSIYGVVNEKKQY